ncbi:hypothetical protein [Paraburkholderia sp. BL10I2N1]|uniref:hypothetical protein n=1 Tax=Paraburkholderia sp. BL10I2N1 TaxID=1938796 RepID=UPI0010EB4AE4|nr:hypothetical protein [Paraburkholderia sp. BL10I2N1]TDN70477.1 hypothetical protein B0G77_3951 [Paraburkholderia sp. BL10I2N1]
MIEKQTEFSSLNNEDFVDFASSHAGTSTLLAEALFRLIVAMDMVKELQEVLNVVNT